VPTFRDNDEVYTKKLVDAFDTCEKYKLAVSAHPLSKSAQDGLNNIKGDFSSLDLMKLADVVITDYSACAFEAAMLKKTLYFYVPDYEIYKAEQGLNVDVLTEISGASFMNEVDLVSAISNGGYDFDLLSAFADKYIENKNTNNTELLADFICSLLEV
jgi:CDP-glycerol glycerophosphotransferase (TagB/SpsB family)